MKIRKLKNMYNRWIDMGIIGKKLHKDSDELAAFYRKHNLIYVYGNGEVAKYIFRYLAEEKMEIAGFVVGNGHKESNLFVGKTVYELDEIQFRSGDGIILGISGEKQNEVFKSLKEKDIFECDIYAQQIFYNKAASTLMLEARMSEDMSDAYFNKYDYLDDLGKKYNTDKSSRYHCYLRKYEFFLKEIRDLHMNILELGVYLGGSLKTWEDYFPNAEIYGVDIDKMCEKFAGGRKHVLICDLADENVLEQMGELAPMVVIDDASHMWSHQIKALYHLLPHMPSGGVYIIEDLGTNFSMYRNQHYSDAILSCYTICQEISKVVTSGEYLCLEEMNVACVPLKREIEFLASHIDMISFFREACVIIKK